MKMDNLRGLVEHTAEGKDKMEHINEKDILRSKINELEEGILYAQILRGAPKIGG